MGGRHYARRRVHPRVVAATVAVLALLGGGTTWWAVASGGDCEPRRTVRLTVAPEMGELADRLLSAPLPIDDGSCAMAVVRVQEPLETVADLGALDAAALPEVWVPDSTLWLARTGADAVLEPAGSLASSPVVLATSRAAVDALGWADAPSWPAALTAGRPVAVPDLARSAEGISALGAVRAALGGGENADTAIVEAVLAAARGPAISVADALDAGSAGHVDAPLVPVSEQTVLATHSDGDSQLVAVYPDGGSPVLDYPVLRVGRPAQEQRAAVDAVVRRLTSRAAHERARAAGYRTPEGAAPAGAGPESGIRAEAPAAITLAPADVRALLARLASLSAPSRILAVVDLSTSMNDDVGTGTRATLARDAARSALTLLPSSSAIGLWGFAHRLDGDKDYTELVPTRRLDADVAGRPQRDVLDEQLGTLPDRLSPGGTGLYDTTLAAVRAAQADYNPDAVNSVLIITDGTDDDEQSVGLQGLLDTLRAEANPDRPVKVIGVALGPDADRDVLQQIADATGGAAYSAADPADLQTVLFDAIRQRQ